MRKYILIAILICIPLVYAQPDPSQYESEETREVIIPDSGIAVIDFEIGARIEIKGEQGAQATVTTVGFIGDPQPMATKPPDTTVVRAINIDIEVSSDTTEPIIIEITYSEDDVRQIDESTITVLKYYPETSEYRSMPTEVDQTTRTLKVTLQSAGDPLLAIGGKEKPTQTEQPEIISSTLLILITLAVVVIAATLILQRYLAERSR